MLINENKLKALSFTGHRKKFWKIPKKKQAVTWDDPLKGLYVHESPKKSVFVIFFCTLVIGDSNLKI